MRSTLALSTRIGVAVLLSLTLITAAVTAFVVTNPKAALSRVTAPALTSQTPTPTPTSPGSLPTVDEAAVAFAWSSLAAENATSDVVVPERNLADTLPNRLYSLDGGKPQPLDAGVVVGTVSSAVPGGAIDTSGTTVDFFDSGVIARVVIVTIDVERAYGVMSGDTTVSAAIRVAGDPDPDQLLGGISDFGRVIAVLDADDRYTFGLADYTVRRDSTLLGFVEADGRLAFPCLGAAESAFIGSLTNLHELDTAATESATVGTLKLGKVVDD